MFVSVLSASGLAVENMNRHETYPGMMTTDDYFYSNSIRLQVDPGYRYYAAIIYQAALEGGGDDMAYTTKAVWA